MPPIMRKVAEMVMKRNDAKPKRRGGEFEAGFEVLNYDQRSLEAQRDGTTGWKERRV